MGITEHIFTYFLCWKTSKVLHLVVHSGEWTKRTLKENCLTSTQLTNHRVKWMWFSDCLFWKVTKIWGWKCWGRDASILRSYCSLLPPQLLNSLLLCSPPLLFTTALPSSFTPVIFLYSSRVLPQSRVSYTLYIEYYLVTHLHLRTNSSRRKENRKQLKDVKKEEGRREGVEVNLEVNGFMGQVEDKDCVSALRPTTCRLVLLSAETLLDAHTHTHTLCPPTWQVRSSRNSTPAAC